MSQVQKKKGGRVKKCEFSMRLILRRKRETTTGPFVRSKRVRGFGSKWLVADGGAADSQSRCLRELATTPASHPGRGETGMSSSGITLGLDRP
jgi:hypothetical protein